MIYRKARRKSTRLKSVGDGETDGDECGDPLQGLSTEQRQRVGNVLYQGAVARIRFQNEKNKSSYQRLFPLSEIIKKRVTSS
jgi:hypothetical protein